MLQDAAVPAGVWHVTGCGYCVWWDAILPDSV